MAAVVAAGRCDITYADYDECQASQHRYAFVSDAATDTLGVADDETNRFAP